MTCKHYGEGISTANTCPFCERDRLCAKLEQAHTTIGLHAAENVALRAQVQGNAGAVSLLGALDEMRAELTEARSTIETLTKQLDLTARMHNHKVSEVDKLIKEREAAGTIARQEICGECLGVGLAEHGSGEPESHDDGAPERQCGPPLTATEIVESLRQSRNTIAQQAKIIERLEALVPHDVTCAIRNRKCYKCGSFGGACSCHKTPCNCSRPERIAATKEHHD